MIHLELDFDETNHVPFPNQSSQSNSTPKHNKERKKKEKQTDRQTDTQTSKQTQTKTSTPKIPHPSASTGTKNNKKPRNTIHTTHLANQFKFLKKTIHNKAYLPISTFKL